MSTQLHRFLTTFRVSLHPFLTQKYITSYRRGKGEGRSEQRGKKREEMRQIERLIEEERKINLIKET